MPAVNINGRTVEQVAIATTGEGIEIRNDTGNPLLTGVPARSPVTTSVPSSLASVEIAAANSDRKGLAICNAGTAKLFLSFSDPATTGNHFLEMPAGSVLFLDQQLIVTNAIYGLWDAVSGTAQVTEFN